MLILKDLERDPLLGGDNPGDVIVIAGLPTKCLQSTAMKNQYFNISLTILKKWLVLRKDLTNVEYQTILKQIDDYHDWLAKINKSNGETEMIKQAKAVRNHFLSYIGGDHKTVSGARISLDRKGYPRVLMTVRTILRPKGDNYHHILKLILTLLNVTKIVTGKPASDFASIITESTYTKSSSLENLITPALDERGVTGYALNTEFSRFHLTTKNSPNGELALADAINELPNLKWQSQLRSSLCTLGGENFSKTFTKLCDGINIPALPFRETLRSLALIQDKEAKTRVVAVLDYWSQACLKSFHISLFDLLSQINEDMTFDQSAFKPFLVNRSNFYCFDLSNSTDRFPIDFQVEVISRLIGKEKAEAWKNILVELPFTYKGKKIAYKAGQPMGAYSSWGVFALCHHVVVWISAIMAKVPSFDEYILLGDDIVIFNPLIAEKYQQIMNQLGVELSPVKTIISKKLCSFAARYFLEGVEISPFSLVGLKEAVRSPTNLCELLRTMHRNGWENLSFSNLDTEQLLALLDRFGRHPKNRTTAVTTKILLRFSLKELISEPEKLQFGYDMDCFGRTNLLRREVAIQAFQKKLEEDARKMAALFDSWLSNLPPLEQIFKIGTVSPLGITVGDLPITDVIGAMVGKFQDLRIRVMMLEMKKDYTNVEWLYAYRSIGIIPDPIKALKQREFTAINLTHSSLLLKVDRMIKSPLREYLNPTLGRTASILRS